MGVCAGMRAVSVDVRIRRRGRGSFRRGSRRYGAQMGRASRGWRWRYLQAFAALSRVSLHGREGLRRLRGLRSRALPQPLARGSSWVRGACSRVSCEGLPEHALLLLRHRLGLRLGAVLARDGLGAPVAIAAPWLVVFAEQLDKVAREQPNHAPVALQPSHPPRAIAGVEHLDQVALYESEVALSLQRRNGGQGSCRHTKGLPSQLTSPPHEYTALHQHGNRVGSDCPAIVCYSPPAVPQLMPQMRYGPRFTRRATATCVCLLSERVEDLRWLGRVADL